ncbi:MAG: oligosaccharide flippase family protein [Anaerolineales bacterium]|nr:oligosaccharide flippase family protein [Anaerolineales bacterium]
MVNLPVSPNPQNPDNKKKTNFSADIFKLVSGTAISLALGVLIMPLLARLYAPAAFGVLALFTSIAGILAVIISLRYEITIMLPESDKEAANLLAGSLGVATVNSLLSIPLVWFGAPFIGRWLKSPELVPYLWLLIPVVFFGGVGAGHPALNAWASRKRNFTQISTTRVIGSLTLNAAKLIAGFSSFNSAVGLIYGTLIGAICSPFFLGWQIWRQDKIPFYENISLSQALAGLKKYRKFSLYNTLSTLLNTVSWQVPSFMLSAFFSTTVVGYYAFGSQLLRVPMDLIGNSIGQAFYSHAAIAHREGTLAVFVENTFRRLVEYSFFPILMLTVIGKDLFQVVFGSQWAESGVYTQILSIWMVFWFVSSPMSQLYSVLQKNELFLGLNVVILITRIVSIWLGGVLESPRLALLFFSISGAVVYGFLGASIIFFSGVPWRRIVRIILENLAVSILAAGALFLFNLIHAASWVQLIVAVVFIGIYFAYRLKDNERVKHFFVKRTSIN